MIKSCYMTKNITKINHNRKNVENMDATFWHNVIFTYPKTLSLPTLPTLTTYLSYNTK